MKLKPGLGAFLCQLASTQTRRVLHLSKPTQGKLSLQYRKFICSVWNEPFVRHVPGDTGADSKQGCEHREQQTMRIHSYILSADHSSDMPYLTTAMPLCTYHIFQITLNVSALHICYPMYRAIVRYSLLTNSKYRAIATGTINFISWHKNIL